MNYMPFPVRISLPMGRVMGVTGAVFGLMALSYVAELHSTISKFQPPCAPIRTSTVLIVLALTSVGVGVSVFGLLTARMRMLSLSLGLLGIALNVLALTVWVYWIASKTLLTYDAWCVKVGMP